MPVVTSHMSNAPAAIPALVNRKFFFSLFFFFFWKAFIFLILLYVLAFPPKFFPFRASQVEHDINNAASE